MRISPLVPLPGGTGRSSGSATRTSATEIVGTPCLLSCLASSAAGSSDQPGWYSQTSDGPYVSVSPYRCVTLMPICCTVAMVSFVGGAPPTAARSWPLALKPRCTPARASSLSTMGAPQRCVTG
jgi:hypothetical protein